MAKLLRQRLSSMYKRHGKDRTLNIPPMLCLIYQNKKKENN